MRNLIISFLAYFPVLCVGISFVVFTILSFIEHPLFSVLAIGDVISYVYLQEETLPLLYKDVDDLLEKLGWLPQAPIECCE